MEFWITFSGTVWEKCQYVLTFPKQKFCLENDQLPVSVYIYFKGGSEISLAKPFQNKSLKFENSIVLVFCLYSLQGSLLKIFKSTWRAKNSTNKTKMLLKFVILVE